MYNYCGFQCGGGLNLKFKFKEFRMSGQVLSTSTGALGVALLPSTGNTRLLFYAAAVLLAGGLVTMAISVVTRKSGSRVN